MGETWGVIAGAQTLVVVRHIPVWYRISISAMCQDPKGGPIPSFREALLAVVRQRLVIFLSQTHIWCKNLEFTSCKFEKRKATWDYVPATFWSLLSFCTQVLHSWVQPCWLSKWLFEFFFYLLFLCGLISLLFTRWSQILTKTMAKSLTSNLLSNSQLPSLKFSLLNFLLCKCMLFLWQVPSLLSKHFNLLRVLGCKCHVNWLTEVTRNYLSCSAYVKTRGLKSMYFGMMLYLSKGCLEWCVWLVLSVFRFIFPVLSNSKRFNCILFILFLSLFTDILEISFFFFFLPTLFADVYW